MHSVRRFEPRRKEPCAFWTRVASSPSPGVLVPGASVACAAALPHMLSFTVSRKYTAETSG